MAKARDVSIRVAVTEAEQAVARLRAIGTEGEQAFQRLARGAGLVPAQVKRAEDAVGMFAGNAGQKFAQIGFQVGDFSTQVAGGTSALVAFSQQAPQLLGAFGPIGAVLGGLGGAAVVAGAAIFGLGRESRETEAATKAMEEAARGLDGTIAGSATSVENLTQKYAALGDEMRTIERLELGKKLRDAEAGLSSIRDQIAASVRDATETGQLDFLRQSEALAKLDPGATRNTGVVQLQQYLEGLNAALEKSAKGGLTEFADEVDRLASSLPEAGTDARKLADSFIAPAESAIKFSTSIRQAQRALDELAGKPAAKGTTDPFKDQAKAAEQAEKATDRATKASQRAAAQADRRRDGIALEIQQNQRLIEAGDKGAAAYEQMRRVIEAENKARAAGLDASSREVTILAEQNRVLAEQAEARKRNARALEEQARAYDDFFRKGGDRIESLFGGVTANENRETEAFRQNLVQATASGLDDGFRKGFGDVDQLVEQFGGLLSSTVATSLADNLISDTFAASIKGGLDKTLGSIMPSLGDTALGSTTVGQGITGALGAGAVGYGIGQSTGSRPAGALAGAGAGAGIGFMVGGWPGAGIGAFIGALGGLLGGGTGGGSHNDNYQLGFSTVTGRQIDFQNTRPGQQNVANVNSVLAQVDALREGLRGLNIAVGETEITLQSGNKSGLTLNGESFKSLGGLTEAALDKLLSAATLTEEQRRVVGASNATDAQGLLADLGFIDQFAQLTGTMSALDAQVKALETSFGVARDKAVELAFAQEDLAALNAAEKVQRHELLQQAGRDRGNILDATAAYMGDDAATLRIAIRNQAAQYDQMRQQMEALGGTTEQLAQLDRDEAAARAHLIQTAHEQAKAEREAQQAAFQAHGQGILGQANGTFGFLDQLRSARDSLATSDLAPGSRLDQYRAARAQFEQTRRLAEAGDLDALNRLAGEGQQFLQLSQGVNASSAAYGKDFDTVSSVMAQLIKQNEVREDRVVAQLKELGIEDRATVQEQTRALLQEIRGLRQEQKEMKAAFKDAAFAARAARKAA